MQRGSVYRLATWLTLTSITCAAAFYVLLPFRSQLLISADQGTVLVFSNIQTDGVPAQQVLGGVAEAERVVGGVPFRLTLVDVPAGLGRDPAYRAALHYRVLREITRQPTTGIIITATDDVAASILDVSRALHIPAIIAFATGTSLIPSLTYNGPLPSQGELDPKLRTAFRLPPPVSEQIQATLTWAKNTSQKAIAVVYEETYPSPQFASALINELGTELPSAFSYSVGINAGVDIANHFPLLDREGIDSVVFSGSPPMAIDFIRKLGSRKRLHWPDILVSIYSYSRSVVCESLKYRGQVSLVVPESTSWPNDPTAVFFQYGRDAYLLLAHSSILLEHHVALTHSDNQTSIDWPQIWMKKLELSRPEQRDEPSTIKYQWQDIRYRFNAVGERLAGVYSIHPFAELLRPEDCCADCN